MEELKKVLNIFVVDWGLVDGEPENYIRHFLMTGDLRRNRL